MSDKYVLSSGSVWGNENVVSIYNTLEQAKEGALNFAKYEYDQLKKYLDTNLQLNEIEWVENFDGNKKYYTAKLYHMKLTICIVECNKFV
jgi:hypothetical protein